MDYYKIINDFIEERYDYLLSCCVNILKYNENIEPQELLSELTIHLYTEEEKIREYIELNKLEAFCVSWLNIQGKYKTSPVNRKYYKSNTYQLDDYTQDTIEFNDEKLEDELYDDEYYRNLSRHFTEEQISKIKLVDDIIPELTKSEQILFEAYFIQNLSYDKICQRYTFYREKDGKKITYKSKKSIYNLMMGLREKINNLINK